MEPAVTSTAFVGYILGKVDNSSTAWQRAYESLRLHPTQLSCLIVGGSERRRFINCFNRQAERLIHFIKHIPQHSGSSSRRETAPAIEKQKIIADIITGHLISDLLSPSFSQLWDKDSLFELVISTLKFAHAEHLRHIADQLVQCPTLLAKLISSEQSRQLVRPWIRILSTQEPNTSTLEAWTNIIAQCCSTCPCHRGLEAILAQWAQVQLVRASLKEVGFTLQGSEVHNQARATVSHEVREALNGLLVHAKGKLYTGPITVATLRYIELEVTTSILSKLCDLMPCRRCFAHARSGSFSSSYKGETLSVAPSTAKTWMAQDMESDEQGLEDVLFNQGIGLWKVVLSAQALRDLQSSKSNGLFHIVWGKLKDLSTGDWIRKSVAQPFDMSTESPTPKVRLFIAPYGAGEILWQVDYGYDSRVHSSSQIVKVWRIGTSQEIGHAATVVVRTQCQWSGEHVARCKKNELDKNLRIKIPALFAEDLKQSEPEGGLEDSGELTSLNLLISNKFHALTNKVFDNILYGEQYAAFPYDPNAKEVEIIKHFETAAFILGRSGTGKTTCLLYKLLSRHIASRVDATESREHCQILVTRSKELAKKLQVELEELIKAQLPAPKEVVKEKWDGTSEETDKTLFGLSRYRAPLVCTFAHFLRLVENTIMENDRENYAIPIRNRIVDFVDFRFFKRVYWPKLAYQGSVGLYLDAGMVFSEIMGVIKGSASSRNGLKPLSREAYISRSPNLAPVFPTPDGRRLLFNLYRQYEDRKLQRGDGDAIDRMINILNGVKRYNLDERLKEVIQEIYVDEVQDQRPLELELMLHLVRSPRGVHFGERQDFHLLYSDVNTRAAGDSAQCISNDSAFRFDNVKALFFDHYAKTEYELSKPTLFALSRNFRSQQGILAFSSFIMSLLWKGFPTMVDKLDPEIGEKRGPKPIIFVGAGVTDLLVEVSSLTYVENDNSSSSATEGSTKQVVVVRDDETQSSLQELLGNKRMVYTILETKGMEYDDVFIYNFFQSSPCLKTMYTLQELLFDNVNEAYAEKNMTMCSELKNLYVAATRPRNRLWLLESSPTSVIDILTGLSRPLVEIKYLDPYSLSQVANTLRPNSGTTVEDWHRAGNQNMENCLYDRALQCYRNAGDQENVDLAQAYIHQNDGREQRACGIQGFRKTFIEAARLFEKLKKFTQCIECFEAAGEYVKAAHVCSGQGHHERAAELFAKAGALYVEDAAKEYYKAGLPKQALCHLYDNGRYESVIKGLTAHMKEVDDDTRKRLATGCNQYIRRPGMKISDNTKEKAFNLFCTDKEKQKYLETHNHDTELIEFRASRGEFHSAIWHLVQKGNLELVLKESLLTHKNRPWPSNVDEFLEEIYWVLKTRSLFEALAPGNDVPESIFTTEEAFKSLPWAKRWHEQINTCRGVLENAVFPSTELRHPSTVEFVSGLILAKTDYFIAKATTLPQLQYMLEYLQSYVEFLKPLANNGLPTFSELTICWVLGRIKEPWGPEIIYSCSPSLDWAVKQRVYTEAEMPQILVQAHKYLSSLVPIATDKILAKASGTSVLKPPNPCQKCASQGEIAVVEAASGPQGSVLL
ncbi:hypothetical protein EV426DRAFT_675679 [Tirmania nivea]|nr:hypothetical protein EV426DRAFT_675679 [Tirmania nivea]